MAAYIKRFRDHPYRYSGNTGYCIGRGPHFFKINTHQHRPDIRKDVSFPSHKSKINRALYDRALTYLNRYGIRGKDRLFGLLSKLGFRSLLVFNAKYGISLNLDPYEYIDSVILKEDFYESEVTEAILGSLAAGILSGISVPISGFTASP
ncbi:hypothetical protein LX99_04242 [Mucilaginibacter oryzae]|uniref:Uncharacterized protein n=1 Tax=Mucilaginibacter oryzae TaxID=468058 RepID=A0A316H0S9_9SPHI|nr:hypothetical protein [Mucilaginibacter oryzae]PWK72912.1 hypothetical protein LX99_04242 [Mucilaginibacter oryzae]